MRRPFVRVVAVLTTVLCWSPTAWAGDDFGGGSTPDGAVVHGSHHGSSSTPGHYSPGQPYVPTGGPPPPVYKDYWTPACSFNGPPPTDAGVACTAMTSVCKTQGKPDSLYMQHWRQQIAPTVGDWDFLGSECRGPDAPTRAEPQVTVEMVLDQAYAAAPAPTAVVQPGNRSYVNVPNNYYADAQDQTVPVVVLGHTIPVTFTVTSVDWDFGDGSTGSGDGVRNASVRQAGAVEHAYAAQGSYDITATSVISVSFVLPGGGQQTLPGALEMDSDTTTLPVGEIQTRVDTTG